MKTVFLCALLILTSLGLIYANQPKSPMQYSKDYYKLIRTKQCRNCNLYKAPLANIDLTGADLSGSNLYKADLRRATLVDANISNVNFKKALLSGAIWIDGKLCQSGSVGICVKKDN